MPALSSSATRHPAVLALLGALAVACTGKGTGPVDSPSDSADSGQDTAAEPVDWDCTEDPELGELSTELAEVKTVVLASWEDPEISGVRFLTGAGHVVDAAPQEAWLGPKQTLLLGLHSNDEVQLRTIADPGSTGAEGEVRCGPVQTVQTGLLDPDMPTLELLERDAEAAFEGYLSTLLVTTSGRWAVLIDELGEVVWARDAGNATRALPSPDGPYMVVNPNESTPNGVGTIRRLPLWGGPQADVSAPLLHTDFAFRPEGGWVALGWELRTYEHEGSERLILGDTLVELDQDGSSRTIWNIFDEVEPDLSRTWPENSMSDPEDPRPIEDWSHANGINLSADGQAWLVTVTDNAAVVRVDRETGSTDWWLEADGEGLSDFSTDDPQLLLNPHSVHDLDGSLLVFNRGDYGDPSACSWASELSLDTEAMAATEVWRGDNSDCLLVPFLGDAQRLSTGHTLVVYSSSGRIEELTPEGTRVFALQTDLGGAFGFARHVPSPYTW